jgi:hypothetical protein
MRNYWLKALRKECGIMGEKPPGSNQELWAKSIEKGMGNYWAKSLQEAIIRNYCLKAFRKQ